MLLVLAALKYAQIVFYSEEKWFHFALIAMLAFGSIQAQQWYLNQKSIDAKMDSLRQKATESASALAA